MTSSAILQTGSVSTYPSVAPRLDALLDAHGARDDAAVIKLWCAVLEDAAAVFDGIRRWVRGYWEPWQPRPPFDAQPWAPRRRRQRKACRR